jgi:ankyrin repeat protein
MNYINYSKIYDELFSFIQSSKYNEFIELLNSINEDDPMFDINIRHNNNNYLLTYAVLSNNIEIVKLLIKKHAKIDIVDNNNTSLLILAISYGFKQMLLLLLEENTKIIGYSLLDITSFNNKTPLLFAIELKNLEFIEILLEYEVNTTIEDNEGQGMLIYAIKTRSIDICKKILQYITHINTKTYNGDNALHIACQLNLEQIAILLLKENINLNVYNNQEKTPLHYTVSVGNYNLYNSLIEHGANINVQDMYGNSILHYAIIYNMHKIYLSLTTNDTLNYNIWNINGEIPLHIILDNDELINIFLNENIISKSNLSIQNNNGDTCLHYLIKNNLWKTYKKILITKKLDIFATNKNNKMPIDLIEKKDYDEFIDTIVDSYNNRLKLSPGSWNDKLDNLCSRDFDKLTKLEKKQIEEVGNCTDIIKNKIQKTIKLIQNKEITPCLAKSYPKNRPKTCIELSEGDNLDFCTFTGGVLDVIIGMITLLKKHKNVCGIITKNKLNDKKLCNFYKSIGAIMNDNCEFLNFEFIWINHNLYIDDTFFINFKKLISKCKFIIIPIGIIFKTGSHAGYLIYDSELNEIERFETYGGTISLFGTHYNGDMLDKLLETKFKSIIPNIKYYKPSDYLPKISFQLLDIKNKENKKIGDPGGFCALWSIWYVDMRLTYTDFNRNELPEKLIKIIKYNNLSFKNLIRNYAKDIIELRDTVLNKADLNLNKWINEQYTTQQVNKVMDLLFEKVSLIQ